jgi:ketosteroid isomerase-like protein
MSKENVEAVRRAFEAFNRGDIDGFLAITEEDVVQDWSRAVGPERGVFCGREQVERFLRSWLEAFEESTVIVDELIDAGDHVICAFHGRQVGRGSGAVVAGRGSVLVWHFRAGRVVSVTLYQHRAEALASIESA